MGKAAAKQARTLELEFTLAPRPTDNKGRTQRRVGSRMQTRDEPSTSGVTDQATPRFVGAMPVATADLRNPDDFPRLSHDQGSVAQARNSNSDSLAQKLAKGSRFTVRNSNGSQNDSEFPSLMSVEASSSHPQTEASKLEEGTFSKEQGDGTKRSLHLRLGNKEDKSNGKTNVDNNQNVSIELMQKYPPAVAQGVGPPPPPIQPMARVTRVSTSKNIHVQTSRGLRLDSDFPSLIPAASTLPEPSNAKIGWVKKDPPKPIKSVASKGNLQTKNQSPRLSTMEDYPTLAPSAVKSQLGASIKNSGKAKTAVVNGIKTPLPSKPPVVLPTCESWPEPVKSRGKKKKNQLKPDNSNGSDETITFASQAERKISEMQLGELKSLSTLMGGTRLDLGSAANAAESKGSIGSKVGLIKQPTENKPFENNGAKPKTKAKPVSLDQSDFPALGQTSAPVPIFFEKPPLLVLRPREHVAPTKVTFTSSSGQSFPMSIDDSSTRKFLQPPDFAARNQQLISTVMDLLCHQNSKIDQFRTVSTQFRSGQLKPEGYYLVIFDEWMFISSL